MHTNMTPSPTSEHMSPFVERHVGTRGSACTDMLGVLGYRSLDDLMHQAIPTGIQAELGATLPRGLDEDIVTQQLKDRAQENSIRISMIGQGFYDTVLPAAIRRGVLEDPSWYSAYTPYQPEISQGRLEALLNFQTVVSELSGLEIAGASLLDEASACAEAMLMTVRISRHSRKFGIDRDIFAATMDVLRNRAEALSIELVPLDICDDFDASELSGILYQYPAASGAIHSREVYDRAAGLIHKVGGLCVVAADPLALTLIAAPAELGADIAIGSMQRYGLPLGGGGPHAAFIATSKRWERQLPGRIVGVSIDSMGHPAYRLALQTREQHIRREKATSNICTAQSLLAIISSMYAIYHGPEGLRRIAARIHDHAVSIANGFARAGLRVTHSVFFDTVEVSLGSAARAACTRLADQGILVYEMDGIIRVSTDERTTAEHCSTVVDAIVGTAGKSALPTADTPRADAGGAAHAETIPAGLLRSGELLSQSVFHRYRTETALMRYMRRIASKDYALDRGMIPLGSCTMKLNSAVELAALSYDGFARIHPYGPIEDQNGYRHICEDLERWLADITGYDAVSLQPNAGSQGELAGLLAIRGYWESRGEPDRTVCLIPASAHGTNAASATLAGFTVAVVRTAEDGSIDREDLERHLHENPGRIAAMMVTFPSTFGTYEPGIRSVIDAVHEVGGQVYIDGANLNALVGYSGPGYFGGDVSHINLHKTFAIPHGGGGPGVGPVAAKAHLAPFLPGFRGRRHSERPGFGSLTSAPEGSLSILPISWAYISLMGMQGLRVATASAVLAANYVAHRLADVVPVLYRGENGLVGHECILDLRPLTAESGITVDDVAKRLIDYGFHAPTMSFPVPGTLMVEPTESENREEIDRFCDAMIAIVSEARKVARGEWDAHDNPLRHAPHTAEELLSAEWNRGYTREMAAYPGALAAELNGRDPESVRALIDGKYWPPVGRINGPWGDRNLLCTCPPPSAFS